MEHYFPFHVLAQWYDIFVAISISLLIFFVVWVLTSLYYWTTHDLLKPVGSLYPMRKITPRTTYKETTTTTVVETAPLTPTKERKRNNKTVRQPVTPKKKGKSPKI